jgi:hypothetical protein
VKDIVMKHWAKYGRHFYCRYDYEGELVVSGQEESQSRFSPHRAQIPLAVDSASASKVMDLIRDEFVNGDVSAVRADDSGVKLVKAEEFS